MPKKETREMSGIISIVSVSARSLACIAESSKQLLQAGNACTGVWGSAWLPATGKKHVLHMLCNSTAKNPENV